MNESTTRVDEQPKSGEGLDDVEDILDRGEAGVVDLISTYERIEELYFVATAASSPATPGVTYSTHT
jgi:hypothetical protein